MESRKILNLSELLFAPPRAPAPDESNTEGRAFHLLCGLWQSAVVQTGPLSGNFFSSI